MAKAKLLFSSPVLAHLSKWILSTWWLPKILELFFLLGLLPSFLQIDPVNFTSKTQFKFTQFFQLPHIFLAVVTGLGKSVFIPIPKKGIAKECSNYYASVLISHASKVMLKILQARLQQYMNQEIPDIQVGFWRGRRTRDQTANVCCIMKKARSSGKTPTSASLTTLKAFDCVDHKCEEFLKIREYQTIYLPPEKLACESRNNS